MKVEFLTSAQNEFEEIREELILIAAIQHHSRKPDHWRNRVDKLC